jgi:hypothetical protein
VPVRSASIRIVSAVPTLPKVPRHPRGELNSPWVLICGGGLLPGERAVAPVVSIVSHGCMEWIVARSDCRFVCGTTSNVQVMSPVAGAGGFESPGLDLNRDGAAPCARQERRLSGRRGWRDSLPQLG